jgi:hypothetical protein
VIRQPAGMLARGSLSHGAPTRDTLAGAAEALGWPGLVLPAVRLLGTRVTAVVTIDRHAHEMRRAAGCAAPVLDVDTLAVWEWPQSAGSCPPSVVALRGVLVPAAHPARPERAWVTAAGTARRWAGFAGTALLLPADDASELCRLECGYAGIGLTANTATGVRLIQPGRSGRSEKARRRTLDRWVEERLYGRLLAGGVLVD